MKTDPAGVLTGVHYLDGDYACGEGCGFAGKDGACCDNAVGLGDDAAAVEDES